MSNTEYIVIPGTHTKVYENSVVVLFRLPDTKWILHCGFYTYNGVKQKGWYFGSIPSQTVMPVFVEDLVAMKVISGPQPVPPGPVPPCPPGPHPPCPPGPHPPYPPYPPAPIPVIFTSADKKMLDASMITVESLEDRDRLSSALLDNGKIVRVNNVEGAVEYYEWDSENQTWIPATLGYRYMTREEIQEEFAGTVVDVLYSDSNGLLTLVKHDRTVEERELTGVAHNPTYADFKIRIPVFGKPDLVVDIPKGSILSSMRVEENYEISPGHRVPALVITEMVHGEPHDIATDVTSLFNVINTSADTDTISMDIDVANHSLSASVKISDMPTNVLNVDRSGLYVDISGKVDKLDVDSGYLLMSDGLGGFTIVDRGVKVQNTGTMGESDQVVPAANLIADAIRAAIESVTVDVEEQISALDERVSFLEATAVGPGPTDKVVTTTGIGVQRSEYSIGSNVLTGDPNLLASEEAVKDAMSWKAM